jgi:phage gpG-like protein
MTIMGCAGTGKSVLISTIVACIRKIFQDNNSVIGAAPTGAAAHNVGGQTIHREFKIDVRKKKQQQIICIITTNPTRKVAIYYCNIF